MMVLLLASAVVMPTYAQTAKTSGSSAKKNNASASKSSTAELSSDTKNAARAKELYNLGNSLLEKGEFVNAKKTYDEALELYRALAKNSPVNTEIMSFIH